MDRYSDYENAVLLLDLTEGNSLEEVNGDRSDEVKSLMKNRENWIHNDYKSFLDSIGGKHPEFLSKYTEDQLKDRKVDTYQLRGFNIGFGLKKVDDGNVDIILVHNSEDDVHGIADDLLNVIKKFGGTQLDHFEGKLSDIYERNGFVEYRREKWNDKYAPEGWDYSEYGKPDIVYRRLEIKENTSRRKRKRYKLLRKKVQKVS